MGHNLRHRNASDESLASSTNSPPTKQRTSSPLVADASASFHSMTADGSDATGGWYDANSASGSQMGGGGSSNQEYHQMLLQQQIAYQRSHFAAQTAEQYHFMMMEQQQQQYQQQQQQQAASANGGSPMMASHHSGSSRTGGSFRHDPYSAQGYRHHGQHHQHQQQPMLANSDILFSPEQARRQQQQGYHFADYHQQQQQQQSAPDHSAQSSGGSTASTTPRHNHHQSSDFAQAFRSPSSATASAASTAPNMPQARPASQGSQQQQQQQFTLLQHLQQHQQQSNSSDGGKKAIAASAHTTNEAPPSAPVRETLHTFLIDKVDFEPYLPRGQQFASPAERDVPPVDQRSLESGATVRLFLGQLPYDIADATINWLCHVACDGRLVYYLERITKRHSNGEKLPTGCLHAFCRREHLPLILSRLHKKVLIDDSGVWIARTRAQEQVLNEYVALMKRDRSKRFARRPYDTIVVQEATSTFVSKTDAATRAANGTL